MYYTLLSHNELNRCYLPSDEWRKHNKEHMNRSKERTVVILQIRFLIGPNLRLLALRVLR